MAGLLEQLFGAGGDDPRSQAMGLLGAQMMVGNTAGGLLGANQVFAGQADAKLKRALLQAQVDETAAQGQERRQKMQMALDAQKRQDLFLNGDPAAVPSQPAIPGSAGGALGGGSFGIGTPGQPASAPQGAGGLIARARALGIPEDAIRSDVVFNGGKKIAEFIDKHGSRDMQVTNGYAYDKNKLGAGYLPQLNTSQDGKTSMVQIDPNTGMPVVSAPQGAQNTYAGYRNIDESAKANFDPVTVTPQGQNPQMTSRGALMRSPQVQGVQPGADAGRAEILNQEVTKAQAQLQAALRSGDATAAQRATNDLTALNRELGRAGGASRATVGMPLQSKPEEAAALERATAPPNYERNPDGTLRAIPGGPADIKAGELGEKREKQRHSALTQSADVLATVADAKKLVGYSSAGVGGMLSGVPMTDARNLQAKLTTIKANLGFDRLQQMRTESPTGGALGQVAVQELQALQATVASLDQMQSPAELKAALDKIATHYGNWQKTLGGSDNKAPAAPGPGAFADSGKEQRYQQWKRSQGK